MRLLIALAFGVFGGFVSVAAWPLGVLVALILTVAVAATSAGHRSTWVGACLLAAGATGVVILGRVLATAASDPAVGVGPGTTETFAADAAIAVIGVAVIGVGMLGRRSAARRH